MAETFGIPVFFIVQVAFLQNISRPDNLPLQLASVIVIFVVSLGLPALEILTGAKGKPEAQGKTEALRK